MTVTVMNRGNRGPGQFSTASYVVPDTVTQAGVLFDLHNNEMGTTKAVKLNVFYSVDNGQTWKPDMGFTAQGPWTEKSWVSFPERSAYPGMTFYHGKRVMAVIDVPQAINCGVILYINELPASVE